MKTKLIIILLGVVNALYATTPDFTNDSTSVVFWGANGSDTTDDTNAFNLAIAYCKGNGYKTMFIPCGTYYISSSLTNLNSSFNMVSVVGENAYKTVLDITGLSSGEACFKTSGGSGDLSNAEISSITFIGNEEETGIELKGSCGVRIRDCIFNGLNYGIIYSNDISSGTFTEYCVAEGCSFESKTAVYFKRGSGDPSFHGSGLKRCTIINRENDTYPLIKVGEGTNPTISLYNSPMDMHVTVHEDIDIIEGNVSTSSIITTYGTITVLVSGANPTIADSNKPIYHHGEVLIWDSDISFGDIRLVEWSATNSDGSINVNRKPFSVSRTLSAETTTITETTTTMLGSMITLTLTASNYDYRYLLFITHNGYGDPGTVKILDTPRTFNTAGLGAPDFDVNNSGQLMVKNSSYASTSVTARLQVVPMGQRRSYFIGD